MILENVTLTPGLAARLRDAGDRPLRVNEHPPDVLLCHEDGSDLCDHEQRRVEGVLAAHRAEPF